MFEFAPQMFSDALSLNSLSPYLRFCVHRLVYCDICSTKQPHWKKKSFPKTNKKYI